VLSNLTDFPFNPQVVKPCGTLKQAAIISAYVDKASDAPCCYRLEKRFICQDLRMLPLLPEREGWDEGDINSF
jgi:hypothetical protein